MINAVCAIIVRVTELTLLWRDCSTVDRNQNNS